MKPSIGDMNQILNLPRQVNVCIDCLIVSVTNSWDKRTWNQDNFIPTDIKLIANRSVNCAVYSGISNLLGRKRSWDFVFAAYNS